MKRSFKDFALISLKGMGMGAADIIPGVSGGTIALITGIYEEFINAIKSFSSVLPVIKSEGLKGAWKHVNGSFILSLFIGIGISLVSLVKVVKYLLEFHPILLWSFFFGLIIASTYYVGKNVKSWKFSQLLGLAFGTILIFYLTSISPSETEHSYVLIFISGMIAICAMILPGISGSFILVLLGKYKFVIESLSALKLDVIACFGGGCLIGILSFSHLLSYLLKKHFDLTMAILTGFMIGSLNKIWPWKKTLEWTVDRHGETVPKFEINVLPSQFDGEPNLGLAIASATIGLALIFILEIAANKLTAKK